MAAVAEPVSLKGTRDPLLLIATGFFLSVVWNPITCMIGAAGLACGAHDLRRCEGGAALGGLRRLTAIAAWTSCALALAGTCFSPNLLALWMVLQPIAQLCAAMLVARLARHSGASTLASCLVVAGCLPLALSAFPIAPRLLAPILYLASLVSGSACLVAAVLTLRVRTMALPYGKHIGRRHA